MDADDGLIEEIAQLAAGADIWCLGEATHGAHEYLELRNRLFAYGVEHLGVTAIALETHLIGAELADAYVRGYRALGEDVVQAAFSANAHFRWTARPFLENLCLLRWMRRWNDTAGAGRPVRLYGLDVGWSGTAGREWDGAPLVRSALGALGASDPVCAARLRAHIAPALPRFNDGGHGLFSPAERDELTEALDGLVEALGAVSGAAGPGQLRSLVRAARHASVARALAGLDGAGHRDLAMAESVRWIRDQEADRGRLFVFASDGRGRPRHPVGKEPPR